MTSSYIPGGDPYIPDEYRPEEYVPTAPLIDDLDVFTVYDLFGRSKTFTYRYAKSQGWVPKNATVSSASYWQRQIQEAYLAEQEGAGSGGGGGGSVGATYQPPDERTVRDQVKAYVVATTGTANQKLIDDATAKYMAEAKRAFDRRETEQVDPWASVQGLVRGSAEYGSLHELRPDSVDELDWVADRQATLRNLGLSAQKAEDLGMEQASVGASDADLVKAAGVEQFQTTGRMFDYQKQQLQNSISAVAGMIK